MKYLQVNIETQPEALEALTGFLLVKGITDTAVEDPMDIEDLIANKDVYHWDYVADEVLEIKSRRPKLMFYMEDNPENRERACAVMSAVREAFPESRPVLSLSDDSDWKDKWKEYFKPSKVSKRIVVKPTWENYEPCGDELVLEIDPGMAFGTGTHETTSLCLKLLEKYMKPSDKVLDVGCGSGILSVGAALLGSKDILAVDIDPEAVKTAKENVSLNGCGGSVRVQQGNLVDSVEFEANIIVANLMADLVVQLSAPAAEHLLPGGIYISSGILVEKEAATTEAIKKAGFEILEICEDGMWCAIAAKRNI